VRLTAIVFAAALLVSGCSSSEPRETQTVHCMKCHRVVSSESVVCTDCAAPHATPVVVVEDDPTPQPQPQPPVAGTPTQPPANNSTPVADRNVRRGVARTLFLNGFPQADSDAVEKELLGDASYAEVTPEGGAPGRRVAYDFKYFGTNLKADLVKIMRKLGYRFHFTEARLQDQVELVKE
jgi:hypothetical protein